MLSSSRALVHVPWRLTPSRITPKSTPRFSKSPSFSTVIARYPGIPLDGSEERTLARNTLRNYATSSQSLHLLIQQEKYDEAAAMFKELSSRGTHVQPHPVYIKAVGALLSRRVLGGEDHKLLIDWFELVPDVRSSTSASTSFERLLDGLRHHIKADPTLAVSIGRVLARKGYKTLVEHEVLPIVKSSLGNDTFASLLQETSQLSAARSSSKSANPSQVFEDASEDYDSILTTSTPPPPSILELVESSLPQTLPPPDPSNQSVFEELDDDYVMSMPTSDHLPRWSAAGQLEQLVRERKYNDAFQLLSELLRLDTPISFSHVYGFAALDALQRPLSADYTPDEQLKLFTAWFSLIPYEHKRQPQSRLRVIQRTIMLASVTSLPLIMQFCTIISAKGYTDLVGKQEIAVVMRFASTDYVNRFIQKLESVNSAYWENYQPKIAAEKTTHFKARLRDLSIRYLAYSGRVEEALSLIPEIGSKISLGSYTLERLLRTMRDIKNPSFTEHVPRIESLLDAVGPDYGYKLRQLQFEAEEAAIAAELRTKIPSVKIEELSKTLRYLKRVLRAGRKIPHPFLIADFLERYLATGRTRAPTSLLNLCLNSSYRSVCIFLFAEMLFYRRMNQPYLIIKTFVDHFYITGVPRDDVLQLYNEAEDRSRFSDDELNARYRPRMCRFSPSQLPRGKAWPLKYHCNLIWHSLVTLHPSLAKLPDLYHKLLDYAEGSKHQFTLNPGSTIEPLPPPPSWTRPVDSAAFTPFMRQMMWISGPNRGYTIIKDMMDVGIRPSAHHYTELAGHCARLGLVGPAIELLNYLEKSSGFMERLIREKENCQKENRGIGLRTFAYPVLTNTITTSAPSFSSPSSATTTTAAAANTPQNQTQTETQVPEPDLIFYISLMRGFIMSQSTEAFQQVHKRLTQIKNLLPQKQFYKDQDEILNHVYADFRLMCRKQGYDYKTERKVGYRTFRVKICYNWPLRVLIDESSLLVSTVVAKTFCGNALVQALCIEQQHVMETRKEGALRAHVGGEETGMKIYVD